VTSKPAPVKKPAPAAAKKTPPPVLAAKAMTPVQAAKAAAPKANAPAPVAASVFATRPIKARRDVLGLFA
jgi:hypothetical protein